jgi:Ca2+-binding RTX toxin-like protein
VGDSNNQLTNQVGLSDGANILWGTDGNDSLIGTAEDNVLIGRGGKDNLSGGPGKNSFLFQSLKDSLLSGFGPDHIRNLKIGADIIGGPNPVAASKVL